MWPGGGTGTGGGTINGNLGPNDNTVPRSDGTGGNTLQPSSLVIDDAGKASGITFDNPTAAQQPATKNYADAGDATTLASANAHADAGDATTLASANAHADAGDATTLASANAHADAGDATTLAAAEAYTDATSRQTPSRSNKNMPAQTTTADGQLACATAVAQTPATSSTNGGYISVLVDGLAQTIGDGTKVADCYFSADGGTTARALKSVVAGDLLYWNGNIAGFQLSAALDKLSFLYATTS